MSFIDLRNKLNVSVMKIAICVSLIRCPAENCRQGLNPSRPSTVNPLVATKPPCQALKLPAPA